MDEKLAGPGQNADGGTQAVRQGGAHREGALPCVAHSFSSVIIHCKEQAWPLLTGTESLQTTLKPPGPAEV